MPSDDYTPIVRGGLRLKGASSSGIKKKKKDKSKTSATNKEALSKAVDQASADAPSKEKARKKGKGKGLAGEGAEEADAGDEDELDLTTLEQRDQHDGKTASERAYEENRRKRLQARLEREGPKTHKQRVEDLNKYLSTLSEHHDMPRIGPG